VTLRLIWTEPARAGLESVLSFIALDNPEAADALLVRIIAGVERLAEHPASGRRLPERTKEPYRELVLPPCRIIYKKIGNQIALLTVVRSERAFHADWLG